MLELSAAANYLRAEALLPLLGLMPQKDIRDRLRALNIEVRTVDLSTSAKISRADVTPMQVASMHPGGSSAVFSSDRGAAVGAMAEAFARWIVRERSVGGIISAGGSGGTTLATAGMRRLPVGVPKIMVSTVASGEVGAYVGPSDIMMLHSVVDVQGVNSITEQVLGNAAHALAGIADASAGQVMTAAGIATLGYLSANRDRVYSGLESITASVAAGVAGMALEAGVSVETSRAGSMVTWFFTRGPVTDFADAGKSDTDAFGRFHRAMLDQGVWLPPSQFEAAFLSTAHTAKDIELTVEAARSAFMSVQVRA